MMQNTTMPSSSMIMPGMAHGHADMQQPVAQQMPLSPATGFAMASMQTSGMASGSMQIGSHAFPPGLHPQQQHAVHAGSAHMEPS
eukprot:3497637-Karenia_brevis.AAC.1